MKQQPLRLKLPQLPQHKPLERRRTRSLLYVSQAFFLCVCAVLCFYFLLRASPPRPWRKYTASWQLRGGWMWRCWVEGSQQACTYSEGGGSELPVSFALPRVPQQYNHDPRTPFEFPALSLFLRPWIFNAWATSLVAFH